MFIYNTRKYNQEKYSEGNPVHKQGHLYYGTVIVGIEVRGQIGSRWIYRVRRGNDYGGSRKDVRYQDRYKYFIPRSIMDPAGDRARSCFADANAAWKALPEEEKNLWEKKSIHNNRIRGRFIFVGHFMTTYY